MLYRFLFSLICFLQLFTPAVAQQRQRDDSVQNESELTYQPPLVPIELSVNSKGKAAIKLAPKCVTPLGTFGAGEGISAVSKTTTLTSSFELQAKNAFLVSGPMGNFACGLKASLRSTSNMIGVTQTRSLLIPMSATVL